MKYWAHVRFNLILIIAFIVVAGAAGAQPVLYDTEGFEQPKFVPGQLPGSTIWNGQDGWVVTADISHSVNLKGIIVQGNTVKDGVQAGEWDASQMDFEYAHLRRNTVHNFKPNDEVEIVMDFYLAEDANKSVAWGLDVYGGPLFRLTWWTVREGDKLYVMDPGVGNWAYTGVVIKRDTWYHARTVITYKNMTSTLYIDNAPVYTSGLIDPCLGLGFAAIFLDTPGDDKMYFDNFVVQHSAAIELAADTKTLPLAGGIVNFTMSAGTDNGNRDYILLGSATGTSPGIALPGGAILPLNWDPFTDMVLALINTAHFKDFLGVLDAMGMGSAQLDSLGPVSPHLVGIHLYFAYALQLQSGDFAASNPVSIEIAR